MSQEPPVPARRIRASAVVAALGDDAATPPWAPVAAVGLGIGFYPAMLPLFPMIVLALASASFGAVLRGLRTSGARARGNAAIVFGMAVLAGSALSHDRGLGTHAVADDSMPNGARTMHESGERPGHLSFDSFSGRLAKDSSSTRSGFTAYRLDVERMRLKGPGLYGEILAKGPGGRGLARLDVLVRGGPLLDSGTRIELRGSLQAGTGGNLLFAQPRDLVVVDRGTPIERFRSRARESVRSALSRVGDRSAGLLIALILGAQDSLDREDVDAFRAAGCTHILALSGEHLSVLAVLALFALKPVLGPIYARLGAALLATLFVWLAGPAPSLLRAVLMVWLGAIALILDRPQSWLSILCLSFVVSLPFDIEAARSLSFVLSYLAVWGLAVVAPRCEFILVRWLPPPLAAALAASLAAQAATAPVVIGVFGSLSLIGAFASIVAAPLVTAFMWWGMAAALLCSAMGFLAPFAVPVSDLLYLLLTGTMKAAAAVPALRVPGTAGRVETICVIAVLTAFVYARHDVGYRLWVRSCRPPLRRALLSQDSPRERETRHVEAPRPEFSRRPGSA
ncbi:MAG: ComEC/Rec2 family competence protein [Rectinemataceae bacterium]